MSREWYVFIAGDTGHECWLYAAIDQPVFAPYVFGITAQLSGYQSDDLNEMYDFEKDYAANAAEGRVPVARLLDRCRLASILFAALACTAAMAIVYRLTGPLGGAAAAMMLAANPLFRTCVQRAVAEGMLSFWLLTGWLAVAAWAYAGRNGMAGWKRAVAVGIIGGFAAMTKLNGGLVIVATLGTAAVLAVANLRTRHEEPTATSVAKPILMGLLAAAIAYLVFTAQSPVTWRDPIDAPLAMLESRSNTVATQIERYPGKAVATPAVRLGLVANRIWHDEGTFGCLGRLAQAVWLDGVIFFAGVTWLAGATLRKGSLYPKRRIECVVACIFVLLLMVPIFAALPLDWERYYLPAMLASTLVQAMFVGRVGTGLCRRVGLGKQHQLPTGCVAANDNGTRSASTSSGLRR